MTNSLRFSFRGGTFLDGLNALVRAHGALEWVLGHQQMMVWLHTLKFPGDDAATPLAVPPRPGMPPMATPAMPRP